MASVRLERLTKLINRQDAKDAKKNPCDFFVFLGVLGALAVGIDRRSKTNSRRGPQRSLRLPMKKIDK